ncbi:SMEK domain-containing protein [Bacillus subtilis]|uniref:SMEK domain-containing protein n=2 Tax=Bacillaceae TaxID=186817 RepID=UPI0022F0D0BF|nr:SMEK domain-containing protein [Bacillus subtilis]WBU32502.1 SMEK domain-containing protein [Bacillus subtilis]
MDKTGEIEMIRRLEEIEDIMKGLSLLQYYIRFSSAKLGLYNINKACEQFFAGLFNVLWDKEYKRLEHIEKNYPGIDLADEEDQSSIQITVDGSKDKLWKTLDKFEKNEQYKKHNNLIHFVVGEKHFKPHEKDRCQFVKSQFNVYKCDRVLEDGNQYQIQIWDLMDLLCLIDSSDTDSSTVSNVREYITNNINEQIKTFKQDLYPIETKNLIPFTAETFLLTFEFTDKVEKTEMYNELKGLYEILNYLQENTRRFIYIIIEVYKKNPYRYGSGSNIVSDPYAVADRLNMKGLDENFIKEWRLLTNYKILDEDDMTEYEQLRLPELFTYINSFCEERKIPIMDLILKPDFSLLD